MSRTAACVSADRVAKTPVTRPGRPVTGYISDEAVLAMPERQGRTEEEKRKAEAEAAAEDLWARRAVAKHAMLLAHGCTGKGCRRRRHRADRAVRDELLDMLQLRPLDGAA